MVNYLDSRRIAGTTAERSSVPIPATQGGWVELGRTTLGSAGDTISVDSLSDKRYYMVLTDFVNSGQIIDVLRLNNDSGSNYTRRANTDGTGEGTGTSATSLLNYGAVITDSVFAVNFLANLSTNEKLQINHAVRPVSAGAATAPSRRENVGKWANTSSAINRIDGINLGTGDFASGSEVVVLGWDPSDTHTTNFWEELADVTASGSSSNLSSGTITAKKYLWIQVYGKSSGNFLSRLTFNNDSGANYAERQSKNGTTDVTSTSVNYVNCGNGDDGAYHFINMFVINNSANEKLGIIHSINTTAGAGNAPNRREIAFKWANTSNQITEIDFDASTGNYDSASFLKVWGAD